MVKDKNGKELHVGDIVVVDSPMQNMCTRTGCLFKDILGSFWGGPEDIRWQIDHMQPYVDKRNGSLKEQYNRWKIIDRDEPIYIPQADSGISRNNLVLEIVKGPWPYDIGAVTSNRVTLIERGKANYSLNTESRFSSGQKVYLGDNFAAWSVCLQEWATLATGKNLDSYLDRLGLLELNHKNPDSYKLWEQLNHWSFVKQKTTDTVTQATPNDDEAYNDCIIRNTSNTPLSGVLVAAPSRELTTSPPNYYIEQVKSLNQAAAGGRQLQGRIHSQRSFYQLREGLKKTNEAIKKYGLNKKERVEMYRARTYLEDSTGRPVRVKDKVVFYNMEWEVKEITSPGIRLLLQNGKDKIEVRSSEVILSVPYAKPINSRRWHIPFFNDPRIVFLNAEPSDYIFGSTGEDEFAPDWQVVAGDPQNTNTMVRVVAANKNYTTIPILEVPADRLEPVN